MVNVKITCDLLFFFPTSLPCCKVAYAVRLHDLTALEQTGKIARGIRKWTLFFIVLCL